MAPEEAFEQGHLIDWKITTQQIENQHNWNQYPILHLFPRFENIVCATRQVIAFWIQAVTLLRLLLGSLRPTDKHSCGKARQKGVKVSNGKCSSMTRHTSCNQRRKITFSSTLDSRVKLSCLPPANTVPHGGQIKACENVARWDEVRAHRRARCSSLTYPLLFFFPTHCSSPAFVLPYHLFFPTICSSLPSVLPSPLFFPALCSFLPAVLPYPSFFPAVCSSLPAVLPYPLFFPCRLFFPTRCSSLLSVLPYPLFFPTLCSPLFAPEIHGQNYAFTYTRKQTNRKKVFFFTWIRRRDTQGNVAWYFWCLPPRRWSQSEMKHVEWRWWSLTSCYVSLSSVSN